ncbi:hypothetical protein PUN28_015755 [Cardiocondyla obscurior]|uniref:Uncharacterized protein n=1 Tax=Cardiocondyla obscurior TaxID=286306 RepID=A0AAW2EWC5_9HYME
MSRPRILGRGRERSTPVLSDRFRYHCRLSRHHHRHRHRHRHRYRYKHHHEEDEKDIEDVEDGRTYTKY